MKAFLIIAIMLWFSALCIAVLQLSKVIVGNLYHLLYCIALSSSIILFTFWVKKRKRM